MTPEDSTPQGNSPESTEQLAANIASEILSQVGDALKNWGNQDEVSGYLISRLGGIRLQDSCTGSGFTCGGVSYSCSGTFNCGGSFTCGGTFAGLKAFRR